MDLNDVIKVHELVVSLPAEKLRRAVWIFSNAVRHLDDTLLNENRCGLVVVNAGGKKPRIGVYSKTNLIAVRLFPESFALDLRKSPTIEGLFEVESSLITSALAAHLSALRAAKACFGFAQSEAFRLSHGEADGLPGIVVDDYQSLYVMQSGSRAGDLLVEWVASALSQVSAKPVFERSSGQVRSMDGLPERTRWVVPPAGMELGNSSSAALIEAAKVECTVAGARMAFNAFRAQKTGLFLDQRENLETLGRFLPLLPAFRKNKGEGGDTAKQSVSMLDLCCYVGAWSAAGASKGVSQFVLVDQDKEALEGAKRNILGNFTGKISSQISAGAEASDNVLPLEIETLHGDLFEHLSKLGKNARTFDVVVADPPAFAKSKKHVPEARRAYMRLTKLASRLVSSQGLYIACSCSRNMSESEFLEVVMQSLQGEDWILLHKGGQSPDHTIAAHEAHSDYLKCFFFMKRDLLG